MAKQYAYYIEGNKVAIVERGRGSGTCSLSGYSSQTTCEAAGGTWTKNAVGIDDGMWKSPQSSVADALEIKYAHSPDYFIKQTNLTHTTITGYRTNAGYLQIKGGSVNYDTTTDVNDFIVLRNAGTFNGLHKITAYDNVDGTNDGITLNTKYSGSTAWSTFEETVTLFYRVDVLNDEDDDIDIPSYLQKALVYYLKARAAEDMGNMEIKEYMMREYKKHIEQYESSLMKGPRIISSGFHAIR